LASEIAVGKTFMVGGIEWIKFPENDGRFVAVAKESIDDKFFDNSSNDFSKSSLLKHLEKKILPKIVAEVGEENVLEFETDLYSLDGHRKYGKMTSKISLPTFDFYRENREAFDNHALDTWWWLATPNGERYLVTCVAPSGCVDYYYSCFSYYGVRPFCIFSSSIFVSREA
jgi:hypothetical protein